MIDNDDNNDNIIKDHKDNEIDNAYNDCNYNVNKL